MGTVYAAHRMDSRRPRLFAIKTTRQVGQEAIRVLSDEARIASQIDHPHVCRVLDLGRQGETTYLVLPYCDGASLSELLDACAQKKLPLAVAVYVCACVASGLHAAHELRSPSGELLQVVHRDVSPQNILISLGGQVLLTDFGVAKAQGQMHRPTETGEVKGKLSFMAPEQVRSQRVDRRADLFALGCVLYQATTGRRPYAGENSVSTLYQLLEQDIQPPSSLLADYPPGLERLLMKSLRKDREERFDSAQEMERALLSWLVEQGDYICEEHLAQQLKLHLGPKLEEKKQRILQLAQSPGSEASRSGLESAPPTKRTEVTPYGASLSSQAAPDASFPSLTRVMLAAAGVLGCVGMALAWMAPAETEVVPKSAAVSAPSALAPQPETVSVQIRTQPQDAQVWWDDELVGLGELSREVPLSSPVHRLSIRRHGYLSQEKTLHLMRDTELNIVLSPQPAKKLSLPLPASQPGVAAPAPRPRVAAPSPRPLPSAVPKATPMRRLDVENPFASEP